MLTVTTWLWGTKFNIDDVAKLAASARRNLKQEHRFIVFVDKLRDGLPEWITQRQFYNPALTAIKGCYARLQMFSPEWQFANGILAGERIACIDLDTVITGPLDPIFDKPWPFVIMQGGNATNPCKFNGALQMLRAGEHAEVWNDFTLERASAVPFYEFPDDQGWLWHKIPNAAGWTCGPESGVYVFHKPGWPGYTANDNHGHEDGLPKGARLVTFSGWRSPERFQHLPWVRDNWRV